MQHLVWKLIVRTKKDHNINSKGCGYPRDDNDFWNELICMVSIWTSKQPAVQLNVHWNLCIAQLGHGTVRLESGLCQLFLFTGQKEIYGPV